MPVPVSVAVHHGTLDATVQSTLEETSKLVWPAVLVTTRFGGVTDIKGAAAVLNLIFMPLVVPPELTPTSLKKYEVSAISPVRSADTFTLAEPVPAETTGVELVMVTGVKPYSKW